MARKTQSIIHPGAHLREHCIDANNLSVTDAASILGVRRQTLSNLLNCKSSITPEMALRFEKAFGIKMDALLKMQTEYEIERMRAKAHNIDVKPYSQSK